MTAGDEKLETNQSPKSPGQESHQYLDPARPSESVVDDSSTISVNHADASPTGRLSHISSAASKEADGEEMSRQVSHAGSLYQNVTTMTSDPRFEVDWNGPDDPNDPKNWSAGYKTFCIGVLSWNTFITILYSTTYTAGETLMMKDLHQPQVVVTLGLTTYLCGLGVGAIVVAPLSEMIGRKPVAVVSGIISTCLMIPCGLATSIQELIIVRFFGALASSSLLACAPGSVGDMVTDEYRSLAMSVWAIGPNNGPVFGPIIGGFVAQSLGWKWNNWIVMILIGFGTFLSCVISESYGPIILQRKAERMRKETGDNRYFTRYDVKESPMQKLKVYLSRPLVMAVTEPICIFWNIYVPIIYSILYLSFVAYPIVFHQIRGWNLGLSGLAFIGIGIGSFGAICAEPLLRKLILSHRPDPATGKPPPEAMLSVICIASICAPAGELWFAWTCAPPSIHWIAPILAGIPFGWGNTAVFIYAFSYLSQSYGIYAASAMVGNTLLRSVAGGTLPLAGPYMYNTLGANWAGTLLGLIEVLIIPIPFVFYLYGGKIRQRSTLISTMQEDKKRMERKRLRLAGNAGAGGDEKENNNNKLEPNPQQQQHPPPPVKDAKDMV